MKAVDFEEANSVLGPPEGEEDRVNSLPIFSGFYDDGQPCTISCWELSDEEVLQIVNTRRLFLMFTAHTHPPVDVSIEDPFSPQKKPSQQ